MNMMSLSDNNNKLCNLLQQKRVNLLEEQLQISELYLQQHQSKSVSGLTDQQALKQIVEWSVGAIAYASHQTTYWNIFSKSSSMIHGTMIGALLGKASNNMLGIIIESLRQDDKFKNTRVFLASALRAVLENIGYRPSLKLIADVFSAGAERLKLNPDDDLVIEVVDVALSQLSVACNTTSVKKLFEFFLKQLFSSVCTMYCICNQGQADALGMLLNIRLATHRQTEIPSDKPAVQQRILKTLDEILIASLFQKECMDHYLASCGRWTLQSDEAKGAKRSKDGSNFTRLLFTTIDEAMKTQLYETSVFLPILFETFARQSVETTEDTENTNAKRKRSEVSLEMKLCFELLSMCREHRSLGPCARLLRLAIDQDVIDISDEDVQDHIQKWTQEVIKFEDHTQVDEQVAVIGLVLEADHRIIQPHLDVLFKWSFQRCVDSPGHERALALLILHIFDTYTRLRQVDTIIPIFIKSVEGNADAAMRLVQSSDVAVGLGKVFATLNMRHTDSIWNNLRHSLLSQSKSKQFMGYLFELFLMNIRINESSSAKVSQLLRRMHEELETHILQEKKESLVPYLRVYAKTLAMSSLCAKWEVFRVGDKASTPPLEAPKTHEVLQMLEKQLKTNTDVAFHRVLCELCLEYTVDSRSTVHFATALGLIDDCLELVMEWLPRVFRTVSIDEKFDKHLLPLVEKILDTILEDLAKQGESQSYLTNVEFYEFVPLRRVMGTAALSLAKRGIKSTDRLRTLLSLVAAMPADYLRQDDKIQILSFAMESARAQPEVRPTIAFLLEGLQDACEWSNIVCDIFSKKHMKSNMSAVYPDCFYNEGLCMKICEALIEGNGNLLVDLVTLIAKDYPEALVSIMMGIVDYFRQQSDAILDTKVLAAATVICNHLERDVPMRYYYLAFILEMKAIAQTSSLPSEALAKIGDAVVLRLSDIPEVSADVLPSNRFCKYHPVLMYVRALCAHVGGFSLEDAKALLDRLVMMASGLTDANRIMLQRVFLEFYVNLHVDNQFSQILAYTLELVENLIPGSRLCDKRPQHASETLNTIVEIFASILDSILAEKQRKRRFNESIGLKFTSTIIEMMINQSADSLRCCEIVRVVVYQCGILWRSRSLRLPRLLLNGLLAQFIVAHHVQCPEIVEALLESFYGLLKQVGKTVSTKCAVTTLMVLREATLRIFEASKGREQDWDIAFSWIPRIADILSHLDNIYRHHAVFWLIDYLDKANKSTVPEPFRLAYKQTAYYFVGMCNDRELQQLHLMIGPAQQALLKTLHEDYLKRHKFTGKV